MIEDVLILAGGFGERLWPASSREFPKQFMASNGGESFLQEAVCRALSLKPAGCVVVITRKEIASACVSQIAPYANKGARLVVLVEPEPRQTSAAVMSGICLCRFLCNRDNGMGGAGNNAKSRATLVLTSDHIIKPQQAFIDDCKKAEAAARDGGFVCFSIPPTEPSTGYGYIKTGGAVNGDGDVRIIEKFVEKPPLEKAKEYLSSGCYSWNSGMFAFMSSVLLSEMASLTPEVSGAYNKVFKGNPPPFKNIDGIDVVDEWTELNEAYSAVPKIAIDKSVAEKTGKAVSVTAHFEWHDVGSWDTFAALCKPSSNAPVAVVDGSNNSVYSDIPVALCGVSDLVVVVKNGALLVVRKGESASVREAVRIIEGNK